jgi:hypothetical protein
MTRPDVDHQSDTKIMDAFVTVVRTIKDTTMDVSGMTAVAPGQT